MIRPGMLRGQNFYCIYIKSADKRRVHLYTVDGCFGIVESLGTVRTFNSKKEAKKVLDYVADRLSRFGEFDEGTLSRLYGDNKPQIGRLRMEVLVR